MAKIKAVVLTSKPSAYEYFIETYQLAREQYPLVQRADKIYGYKGIPAILVYGWQEIMNNGLEAYAINHDMDFINVAI